MKKAAIFIGVFILLVFSLIYGVIHHRSVVAKQQLIDINSQRIINLGVDQLVIDNLSDFVSFYPTNNNQKLASDHLFKEFVLKAGIQIPANLYMFGLKQPDNSFFGILKVNNYNKCFSYFAESLPEHMSFIDKQNSLVYLQVNKYLQLVFNKDYLVYQLSPGTDNNPKYLVDLINNTGNWVRVQDFNWDDITLKDQHLLYWQKDNKLQVKAKYKRDKIAFWATYRLQKPYRDLAYNIPLVDNASSSSVFIQSALPLKEFKVLQDLVYNTRMLEKKDIDKITSFQFCISTDLVDQQVSEVVYDYDSDFNPIQVNKVSKIQVPLINILFGFEPHLKPELFVSKQLKQYYYDFYGFSMDQLVGYSTNLQDIQSSLDDAQTAPKMPLYINIDFSKLPVDWSVWPLQNLRENKASFRLDSTLEKTDVLHLKATFCKR
ncbi:hypothetical protein ACYSNV_04885 [Myroides sp. LJL119]